MAGDTERYGESGYGTGSGTGEPNFEQRTQNDSRTLEGALDPDTGNQLTGHELDPHIIEVKTERTEGLYLSPDERFLAEQTPVEPGEETETVDTGDGMIPDGGYHTGHEYATNEESELFEEQDTDSASYIDAAKELRQKELGEHVTPPQN